MRTSLTILAICGLTTAAHAQFGWDPGCASASATNSNTINGITDTSSHSAWTSGLHGAGLGVGFYDRTSQYVGAFPNYCLDATGTNSYLTVNGLGSNTVQILYRANASTFHICVGEMCNPWNVFAQVDLSALACFLINNGIGPDVTVYYSYVAISLMDTEHEGAGEDPVNVANSKLNIAGGAAGIAPNALNLTPADINAFGYARTRLADAGSFAFDPASGPLTVDLDSRVNARVRDPGPAPTQACPIGLGADESAANVYISIVLSIDGPVGPLPYVTSAPTPPPANHTPQAFALEWGIDIGSDAELSDPSTPVNNVFDPGDMYAWSVSPAFSAFDGVRNDLPFIAPAPFLPEPGLGVPAPACVFPPLPDLPIVSTDFLDTDASDALDFDIRAHVNPNLPLLSPIARGALATATIHGANHVLLSYDEDDPVHYAFCSLPTNAAAPGAPYGSPFARDELVAHELIYAPTGAFPPIVGIVGITSRVAAESDVHPSLAPDPDPADPATLGLNDDIDALDAQWSTAQADRWYFSVDAEAHSFDPFSGVSLDPGDVYLAVAIPPAPVRVVDNLIHLGLLDGVDIDAFEFVWLPNPNANPPAETLALIFSVDDDDTLTPADESGGLDPAMLYASYLDGVSFPILPHPAQADIDAVTTWSRAMTPLPGPCIADLAPPFGALDFSDVIAFLVAFSNGDPAADLFPDGSFDFSDVIIFLNAFANGCP